MAIPLEANTTSIGFDLEGPKVLEFSGKDILQPQDRRRDILVVASHHPGASEKIPKPLEGIGLSKHSPEESARLGVSAYLSCGSLA